MTIRDFLTLLGTILLAVAPEIKETTNHYDLGRILRVVGVVLVGSRAAIKPETK